MPSTGIFLDFEFWQVVTEFAGFYGAARGAGFWVEID